MDIEAAFGLGLGGFDALPPERQSALVAWWKVKHEPAPKKTVKPSQMARALQAAKARGKR